MKPKFIKKRKTKVAEKAPSHPPKKISNTRKDIPQRKCLNCSHTFKGYYCPLCGQDIEKITFTKTISEFFDVFVLFDPRAFKTFLMLMSKPGQLTSEYLQGRRVRYISPAQLYFFLSIFYFLIFTHFESESINMKKADIDSIKTPKKIQTAKNTKDKNVKKKQLNEQKRKLMLKIRNRFLKNYIKFSKDRKLLRQKMSDSFSYVIFFLLPFFTLLLKIMYRKRYRFAQHFIFALNYHSFVYLLKSIELLIQKLILGGDKFAFSPALALTPIWLFLAMKIVYKQSYGKTFLKFTIVGTLHASMVLIVMFLALVRIFFQ